MHLLVALNVHQQSLNRRAPLFLGCCSACRYLLYLAFIPAIVVMCSIPFVNFVPYTQKSELSTRPQFCTTGRLCSLLTSCLILGSNWFWSSCFILGSNWFWSSCLVRGSKWLCSTRASGKAQLLLLYCGREHLGRSVEHAQHTSGLSLKQMHQKKNIYNIDTLFNFDYMLREE